MLALGASVGGLVTALAGAHVAFILNAARSSARPVHRAATRCRAAAPPAPSASDGGAAGVTDLVEGLRYVRQHPHVAAMMLVKAGWGLAGGVLLLLTIFGQRIFPVGGRRAAGIGMLRGARRRRGARSDGVALVSAQQPSSFARAIGPGYFIVGGILHRARRGADAAAGGAVRALRAFRRQHRLGVQHGAAADVVPDALRGRVFATELALMTLGMTASNLITGWALDTLAVDPRTLTAILGAVCFVPGTSGCCCSARAAGESAPPSPERAARSANRRLRTAIGNEACGQRRRNFLPGHFFLAQRRWLRLVERSTR